MATETPPTRTAFVHQALREKILGGEIRGGEPLRQIAIARELGVSQIPVREALLRLAAEGLVDFIPHRGAVAIALTEAEIRELTHLRALIEADLLASAVPRLGAHHLAEAEAALDDLEGRLHTGQDIERWSALNQRFHMALYAAAGRPVTLELADRLHRQSDRYIRLQLLLTDWIPQAEAEHRALLALCRDGRTQEAVDLLIRHIREAGESIARVLADQGEA